MGVATAAAWNLGLPTLAVLWLALARDGRLGVVITDLLVALSLCLAILLSGLWLAVPAWLILVPLLGIAPAAWARIRRNAPAYSDVPARRTRIAAMSLRGIALVAGLGITASALLGRLPLPGDSIALASPLPRGSWLVANGGSTSIINPHLRTLDGDAATEWRGQSYAVDLVGASAWGSRVGFRVHPELAEFEIYDTPVLAPCGGRIVIAHDGEPERSHPSAPWRTRPGNHVVIDCGRAWVLLAHLTTGSVLVQPGVDVREGDPIGRVGNTGASGEPHLHVHAQSPGSAVAPFGGTPYPIKIDGRFLVRNDRLRSHRAPPDA